MSQNIRIFLTVITTTNKNNIKKGNHFVILICIQPKHMALCESSYLLLRPDIIIPILFSLWFDCFYYLITCREVSLDCLYTVQNAASRPLSRFIKTVSSLIFYLLYILTTVRIHTVKHLSTFRSYFI